MWGFRNFAGRRAGVSSAHYPDLATRSERNLVRRSIQLPSPALVVACLALGVSLTGVGYAAVVLPTNSVGTVQLRDNAVVSKKVQNRSLLAIDFKAGQLPAGPRGLQGEKGANGDTGSKGDKGEKGDKGAKGDAGAAGPPGISGYQVVQGANPVTGTLFHSNTIDCPAGKKVLGGGGFVNGVNGAGPHLVASTPKADGSGWIVTSTKSAGSLAVVGYAICANVTP